MSCESKVMMCFVVLLEFLPTHSKERFVRRSTAFRMLGPSVYKCDCIKIYLDGESGKRPQLLMINRAKFEHMSHKKKMKRITTDMRSFRNELLSRYSEI